MSFITLSTFDASVAGCKLFRSELLDLRTCLVQLTAVGMVDFRLTLVSLMRQLNW